MPKYKYSEEIKELQKKLGVKADGYLGKDTWKALNKHYGTNLKVDESMFSKPSEALENFRSNTTTNNPTTYRPALYSVKQAQTFLNEQGFTGADGKALAEDNINGKNTRHAVTNYQRKNNLYVTGNYRDIELQFGLSVERKIRNNEPFYVNTNYEGVKDTFTAYDIDLRGVTTQQEVKEFDNDINQKKPVIVVDFGHGWVPSNKKGGKTVFDPGAIGKNSNGVLVRERDLIELYGNKLVQKLREAGFVVIETNKGISEDNPFKTRFQDRLNVANQNNPQLYISLHVDSNSSKKEHGCVFYYHEDSGIDSPSYTFGKKMNINTNNKNVAPEKHRSSVINVNSYYCGEGNPNTVTRGLGVGLPALLCEVGNIQCPQEVDYLLSQAGSEQVSSKIAAGLVKAYKEMANENNKLPPLIPPKAPFLLAQASIGLNQNAVIPQQTSTNTYTPTIGFKAGDWLNR